MDQFPLLYDTQDSFRCFQNEHTFCVVDAKLGEGNQNSTTWRYILQSMEDNFRLDRTYIHRGFCLPPDKWEKLLERVTKELTNEISQYNLTVDVHWMFCQNGITPLTAIDVIFLLMVLAIILAVATGTIRDFKATEPKSSLEKILLAFSLRENWKKIVKTTGDEEFTRLKCIQGFRVLAMFGVISIHSFIKINSTFFHNSEVFEEMLSWDNLKVVSISSVFVVHIFLVISAFLLANQIYNHHEKNGSFTLRDVLVLISNRYLRLYTLTVVFVIFSMTSLLEGRLGALGMKIFGINKNACKKSWITTMFFNNNFMPLIEQCYATSWYLSVDFQAYILIVLTLYIILKNKLNPLKVMLQVLLISILVFATYIIVKNPRHVIYTGPFRIAEQNLLFPIEDYTTLYTSTMSTLPTSFAGMIFGYIYHKTKKYNIDKNVVYDIVFYVIFYGLQGFCISLSSQQYNRLFTGVIGSTIKVIYVIGIAGAIIAMSFGIGGTMKKILESKYFIILGNISFSVYMSNFMCMILSQIGVTRLETFSAHYVMTELLLDSLASIGAGIVLTLFVEQPLLSLQKMYLPQLKKSKHEVKNE